MTIEKKSCECKVAKIKSIKGKNGSYLAEFFLEKGNTLHESKPRASSLRAHSLNYIYQDPRVEHARFKLRYADQTDTSDLSLIIDPIQPDRIYNPRVQIHLAVSLM